MFVVGRKGSELSKTMGRFIQALFGHNGISPTRMEYGMYTAAAASLRSIDLSRQVGAAIFTKSGEVATVGCNEVPKAFGGTYWDDDGELASRDFELGMDPNFRRKIEILHDLIERLTNAGYLSQSFLKIGSVEEQIKHLLDLDEFANSQVMDIIEFGRVIHAEMSAISDAARQGRALADGVMYCTTFPCHMCAKHIVASGIRRVVFLEPYPKSYAQNLHWDSITFTTGDETKVVFEPFIGISPRRYRDIFEKKSRKRPDGKVREWNLLEPVPQLEDKSTAYVDNEDSAIAYCLKDCVKR